MSRPRRTGDSGRACVLGLLLLAVASTAAAPAPARPVDLQALVDAAVAGSVVQLEAGRHGPAVIDKPLVLRGRGPSTVVDAGGGGRVLSLRAPDITVEALRVTGSGADLSAKDSGIWVDGAAPRARVEAVEVEVDGFGIWVDGAPRPEIHACRIIGREDVARVSDRGNGVHLFHVTAGLVRANTITGGRDGVYISNSTGCRIVDNRMRRTRFGVHYMYSHANRVLGNTVDSASVGIALMYSKDILVRGNRVRHGRTHGILLRNLYGSRIEGNTARDSQDGLFFSGCSYDTLEANLVTGNRVGILVSDSPDNRVAGNAFVGNDEQLQYEDNRTLRWGAGGGNYWSDYLGWDRDGDGLGDRGHFPADIASYLVRRYPAVRLLMQSPAMVLLQALESRFPVLRPPGVWDLHPLMTNPLAGDSPAPDAQEGRS